VALRRGLGATPAIASAAPHGAIGCSVATRPRGRVPGTGGANAPRAHRGVEMSIRTNQAVAVLALSTAMATAAASPRDAGVEFGHDQGLDPVAVKQEAERQDGLQAEEVRLRTERAAYPAYFKRAYAAYPQIRGG